MLAVYLNDSRPDLVIGIVFKYGEGSGSKRKQKKKKTVLWKKKFVINNLLVEIYYSLLIAGIR